MTEAWETRLLAAMDADPPFAGAGADPDQAEDALSDHRELPEPEDAVAGHVLTAAAIGYPTAEDAAQILDEPRAFDQLARLWSRQPPEADVLARAGSNPALAQLLAATGHDLPNRAPAPPTRLAGRRRRSGYALAAADEEQRHTQTWPGGQLVRQRLDHTIAVSVGYAGPDGVGRVLRLTTDAEPAFRLLLMLTPDPADPAGAAVGQSAVSDPAALDAITVEGPLDPAGLTDADLAVLPDSVAWARGESVTAWRQAARQAGPDSPLHRAALAGRRRS